MSLIPPANHSPEIEQVKELRACFKEHPLQINKLNSSDCEVIKIGDKFLVTNLDTLSEEVELGLYKDPKTIGRVAAISCLSDLAACGVKPLQIMQSVTWARNYTQTQKNELQIAYSSVLELHDIQLSGGDTSEGPFTTVSSMAQGICPTPPISRLGANVGDFICLLGKLGDGPALAISFLLGLSKQAFSEENYNPQAHLEDGVTLSNLASAVIDTSDGVMTALNHLKNINTIEFNLDLDGASYSKNALQFIKDHEIEKVLLWIVEHGDYQLLATIPAQNLEEAKSQIEGLSVIGRVTDKKISTINTGKGNLELNLTELCQSLFDRRHNPSEHLIELNTSLKTGKLL
jgi:thiamine-monophosphate kinase